MKLSDYLLSQNETAAAFAQRIDVAPSTITRILRGERLPRVDLALKIKKATTGAVIPEDFVSNTEAAE